MFCSTLRCVDSSRRRQIVRASFGLAALVIVLTCATAPAAAQQIAKSHLVLELDRIFGPMNPAAVLRSPVHLSGAGDGSGRLFVTAAYGETQVMNNGVFSMFLDLRSETLVSGGNGMLGHAFHPGYTDPQSPGFGKFYTFHSVVTDPLATVDFGPTPELTAPITHHNLVTEWTVDPNDPNKIDVSSRREVFRQAHLNDIHCGGMLTFGPDGYLYGAIGTPPGNTATVLSGQNPANLYGTIFRIDPLAPASTPGSSDAISVNGKYRVPSDNPYVNDPQGLDEIFAIGVRNPYRFSIDPVSQLLFAGDVGSSMLEEISVIGAGSNQGWPYREGSGNGIVAMPPSPPVFNDPIAEYGRTDGRSVTGGYVYRGSIPELQGKYIFGELSFGTGGYNNHFGRLFWLDPFDEDGNLKSASEIEIHEFRLGHQTRANSLNTGADVDNLDMSLYSFGIGDDGEIYVLGTRVGTSRAIGYKVVSALMLEGDFSGDGIVGGADLAIWKSEFGTSADANFGDGDSDGDGDVDGNDFLRWQRQVSLDFSVPTSGEPVPEPHTLTGIIVLLGVTAAFGRLSSRRRR